MGLIFFLSAQPDLSSGLGVWDTILRKLAHMTEYGLLWLLWWRALGYGHPAPSVAVALGYAITDEIHQSFVDGRHGTPVDVAIDAAGIGLAGLAVLVLAKRGRRQGGPADARSWMPGPSKIRSGKDAGAGDSSAISGSEDAA